MGLQLRRIRLPNHDIQLDGRFTRVALQHNLRDVRSRLEAAALVVLQVLLVTTLQIAFQSFRVRLYRTVALFSIPRKAQPPLTALEVESRTDTWTYVLGHHFYQGCCVAFPSSGGFRADVDEVPGIVVIDSERSGFRVVQEG